jgi:deazaflavin-dependent oxidoreductase (nitroreductase family)
MPELRVRQNKLQRWLQWLPASALGAALFARCLHHLDRVIMNLSGARVSVPQWVVGLPTVTLTSTGARSGKPRRMPLIGVPDGNNVILIASNWGQKHHPAWYFNLLKYPQAKLEFDGHSGSYRAREIVAGDEYERLWRKAAQLYIGYDRYRTRTGGRTIPMLLLEPECMCASPSARDTEPTFS